MFKVQHSRPPDKGGHVFCNDAPLTGALSFFFERELDLLL